MSTFKDAFRSARKAGKKTFTWQGKSYTTALKEKEDAPKRPRTPGPGEREAAVARNAQASLKEATEKGRKDPDSTFRSAFAAAREDGKSEFQWQGKKYSTKTKGA